MNNEEILCFEQAFCQALHIPENVFEANLQLKAGEIPIILTKAFVPNETSTAIVHNLLRKYELRLINTEVQPVWDLVKFCQTGNGY